MAYKWSVLDVFSLLGIRTNDRKEEVYVECPFCGSKRFAMNQRIGAGHCWSCNESADSASYYAKMRGLSVYEARKDIERCLGLNYDTPPSKPLPPRRVLKEATQSEMAKIDVLDHTYRAFLAELTLSEKNKNGLLARGFSEDDIESLNYRTFPNKSNIDFENLCKKLLVNGCTLKGVPGFFKTNKGAWTFVSLTQGVIMPSKTVNNKIYGLQVRVDNDLRTYDPESGRLSPKCLWFSSKGCNEGCASTSELNFSCDFKYDNKSKKFWPYITNGGKLVLTEGTMKADLIHSLMPNLPVISLAGVSMYKALENNLGYLKKLGINTILDAYDMDYLTNTNVFDAREETKRIIKQSGMNYLQHHWDTGVVIDGVRKELLKGLDDFLAYQYKGIIPEVKDAEKH